MMSPACSSIRRVKWDKMWCLTISSFTHSFYFSAFTFSWPQIDYVLRPATTWSILVMQVKYFPLLTDYSPLTVQRLKIKIRSGRYPSCKILPVKSFHRDHCLFSFDLYQGKMSYLKVLESLFSFFLTLTTFKGFCYIYNMHSSYYLYLIFLKVFYYK